MRVPCGWCCLWALAALTALARPARAAEIPCAAVEPVPPPGTFLYFAYGSNLWQNRLRIKNPSAKLYSVALLKDYRLDFAVYAPTWCGAVATVVPDAGAAVWGALWTVNNTDLPNLDRQEGVHIGMYYAKNVTVVLPGCGRRLSARTYQETKDPPRLQPGKPVPRDRRPSVTYINLIVEGARRVGLPSEYIEHLKSFRNNGETASIEMLKKLGPPFYNENPKPNSKPICVSCEFITVYPNTPELS